MPSLDSTRPAHPTDQEAASSAAPSIWSLNRARVTPAWARGQLVLTSVLDPEHPQFLETHIKRKTHEVIIMVLILVVVLVAAFWHNWRWAVVTSLAVGVLGGLLVKYHVYDLLASRSESRRSNMFLVAVFVFLLLFLWLLQVGSLSTELGGLVFFAVLAAVIFTRQSILTLGALTLYRGALSSAPLSVEGVVEKEAESADAYHPHPALRHDRYPGGYVRLVDDPTMYRVDVTFVRRVARGQRVRFSYLPVTNLVVSWQILGPLVEDPAKSTQANTKDPHE